MKWRIYKIDGSFHFSNAKVMLSVINIFKMWYEIKKVSFEKMYNLSYCECARAILQTLRGQ